MRPSKLRLPERTATAVTPFASIASATGAGKGPEFPMQVMQPNPTGWKPSASSERCSPLCAR